MRAPFGLAGHSTLTDQNEDSQEHTFGRDDEGQDAERKWVKCFEFWDQVEIYQAPSENRKHLSQQESHVAHELCNYVANSLSGSPATKGVTLQAGDRIDVVLRRIRSGLAWQWAVRGVKVTLPRSNSH
jgi:hypothetical protein